MRAKRFRLTTRSADHVIRGDEADLARALADITRESAVGVALDGAGRATGNASLRSVRRGALILRFGQAKGPVTDVALGTL